MIRFRAAVAFAFAFASVAAAAAARADAVVVAAGDVGDCSRSTDTAVGDVIRAETAATVLALGDLAYDDGTLTQFRNCYDPAWGSFKARTRPVPGNHEYRTSGASGYFTYFGSVAGPSGRGYYSFDLGDWHVVALNSAQVNRQGLDSTQLDWLRADLAATTKRCILAYDHHPWRSSGEHGPTGGSVSTMASILHEQGVTLLLSGHDHDYERFAPMTPSGTTSASGVRQFVVGTGGSHVDPFGTIRAGSQARSRTHGVLRLTLKATGYDWRFLPVAGKTYSDFGSGTCVARPRR
jgi:hypothetical protein